MVSNMITFKYARVLSNHASFRFEFKSGFTNTIKQYRPIRYSRLGNTCVSFYYLG